jgi:tagatose-1,6-bisphosphate aldolase non-catalytic subunit AgaZ/GatZ
MWIIGTTNGTHENDIHRKKKIEATSNQVNQFGVVNLPENEN